MKDPYKTLGVTQTATDAEIKTAYRKLAQKYHPDRNGGNKSKETRFKDISSAYSVIGDKKKRAEYDAMQSRGFSSQGAGAAGFEDLFSQIFSRTGAAGGSGAGPMGGNHRVRYQTGPGFGSGDIFESFSHSQPPRTPQKPTEKKVRAADGSTITLRGKNAYSDVKVSLSDAVLGTTASISTLTGTTKMQIPAGTSSGAKLRLRGKGPHGAGDHIVSVQIKIPKKLSAKAKKLFLQFSRELE